jgi:HEAT repeat protein
VRRGLYLSKIFYSFHLDENRQQLVNAGAIPVLVSLLNSPDTDVQYYCTTALSNIAVDGILSFLILLFLSFFLNLELGSNRKKLAQGEPKLVTSLVMLMDSPSLKVQCQAALALRNLASDGQHSLPNINLGSFCFRKIPIRNCQGRWIAIIASTFAVHISSPYLVISRMRSQRVNSPSERISNH